MPITIKTFWKKTVNLDISAIIRIQSIKISIGLCFIIFVEDYPSFVCGLDRLKG